MGPRPQVDPAAVEAEVERIAGMNKSELKALWRELRKCEPPPAFGPDLLRRSLAYHVQETAFGGLPVRVQRGLDSLVRQIRQKPSSRIEVPRRIKSGAVLIREWKGKVFRVTVVNDQFLHEGKTYSSLSEIANLITGTNWNGPRFFGLRPSTKTGAANAGTPSEAAPRKRGRPRKSAPSEDTALEEAR